LATLTNALAVTCKGVFLALLCLLAACSADVVPEPKVEDGVLDLTQWDFNERGSIRLDGAWGYLPGELRH